MRAALVLLAATFLPCAAAANDRPWIRGAHPSMGTVLEAELLPRGRRGEGSLQAAFAAVDGVERVASHWDPSSELSRFNASPAGQPHRPSPVFAALFERAEQWRLAADGAFSCRLEPYLSWKGFMPPAPGRRPSGEEIAARCDLSAVRPEGQAILKDHPGAGLDFDGLAKGYALDLAAEVLRGRGRAFALSYGSSGILEGGAAARALAITDPRVTGPRAPALAAVWVESGAWGSSSCAENRRDGACHILDPRTLESVATPLLSATVLAPSAADADALSTALMVLGPERGLALLGRLGLQGVLICSEPSPGCVPAKGLYVLATPGLAGRLEVAP